MVKQAREKEQAIAEERERGIGRSKREKTSVRALLESLDWRNKQTYFLLGKILLFVFMVVIESFILIQQIVNSVHAQEYLTLVIACIAVFVLTTAEAVRLIALREFKAKLWCYCADMAAAFFLTAVTGSRYLTTLYMIILTDYYLSAGKISASLIGCFVSLVVYVVTMWVSGLLRGTYSETFVSVFSALAQSFNDLIVLIVHFIAVALAARFYRLSMRLSQTLRRLDESNERLEEAYADLAEATAIEERQRIAKDIHDTAGHSITTVIMQTEAAKLIIDENPAEAKQRIVAANLQAKHALEELRESVHLLSGQNDNVTLKEALTAIVRESCDGTGIAIRCDIDDVQVSSEVFRFLCNTLKEGISNGLRHGGATAFYLEVKETGENLRFLLSDNGNGITQPFQKGFGLTGMEDRAKKLGGRVYFSFDEEGGFEIEAVLPVTEEEKIEKSRETAAEESEV